MATAASKSVKDFVFEWEGKDRNGKQVRGETRAVGENQVLAAFRRQGIVPGKIKKRRMSSGKRIKPKDIAIFTRQLATMMKAGVPLLQSFDTGFAALPAARVDALGLGPALGQLHRAAHHRVLLGLELSVRGLAGSWRHRRHHKPIAVTDRRFTAVRGRVVVRFVQGLREAPEFLR